MESLIIVVFCCTVKNEMIFQQVPDSLLGYQFLTELQLRKDGSRYIGDVFNVKPCGDNDVICYTNNNSIYYNGVKYYYTPYHE